MNPGQIVFAQVMNHLPRYELQKCVNRYQGNHRVKKFTCLEQFLTMIFAQLTYRESLRDIEVCLQSNRSHLYHMGLRTIPRRSTLAEANEKRNWQIYADFAQILVQKAKRLYRNEDIGLDLQGEIYALDSTTINLCLSLFPWAEFRQHKAAIKAHTLLNLRGDIPEFIYVSDGKLHDVNVLDLLPIQAGSYYVMDRGYVDFSRLYGMHQSKATFVTRSKSNMKFQRRYSRPVDKSTGLRSDQTIILTGVHSAKDYPEPLRRISYWDCETDNRLVFITNDFLLPAFVVTLLYKRRWRVELFFKWIKQHLRIKAFYGTSANAVKTQLWIGICSYLLVTILKKELGLKQSLYTILQFLSVSIFMQTPISQAFSEDFYMNPSGSNRNQLMLFDL